jgi:hypothetical protein
MLKFIRWLLFALTLIVAISWSVVFIHSTLFSQTKITIIDIAYLSVFIASIPNQLEDTVLRV